MSARLSLTIEGDSMAEIYAAMQLELARVQGNLAPAYTGAPRPIASVPSSGNQPGCSGGHGVMRLIPGGTAKSGLRIGQPYPAFWKCDTCGERRETS